MSTRVSLVALAAMTALALPACSSHEGPMVIGALYPLTGPQAAGGRDEYRGVVLATDMINGRGGVDGRRVRLDTVDVSGSDAAPGGVAKLARDGVKLVLGSYGSTISMPAAAEAARRGMLFWETGAVGEMAPRGRGRLVFRVAPSGAALGRTAIAFVARRLARRLHRPARSLRFAVANVDDAYGRSVAEGALEAIKRLGVKLAGRFPYPLQHPRLGRVASRIKRSGADVLFVSAYLRDGIELRRQTVRRHVRLAASIGTSSSYCMPGFGDALGRSAVGLFASDKPDAVSLDPQGLDAAARRTLAAATSAYRRRFHAGMSAPALAGFSAAWALFTRVLPRAQTMTPSAVGAAASRARIPTGGLPNGSGLAFGPPGTALAGSNLRAASVIWEWVGIGRRAVVWPPRYSTAEIESLPLAR